MPWVEGVPSKDQGRKGPFMCGKAAPPACEVFLQLCAQHSTTLGRAGSTGLSGQLRGHLQRQLTQRGRAQQGLVGSGSRDAGAGLGAGTGMKQCGQMRVSFLPLSATQEGHLCHKPGPSPTGPYLPPDSVPADSLLFSLQGDPPAQGNALLESPTVQGFPGDILSLASPQGWRKTSSCPTEAAPARGILGAPCIIQITFRGIDLRFMGQRKASSVVKYTRPILEK